MVNFLVRTGKKKQSYSAHDSVSSHSSSFGVMRSVAENMTARMKTIAERCMLNVRQLTQDTLCVQLVGRWTVQAKLPVRMPHRR